MSTMTVSYMQRLQRLYTHFRKDIRSLLGDCCALIDLIDEDDLTNWYVLLRYEDENKAEFFVSLRVYFLEELQRMPLVFVIAPRLVGTFIHHGAICSLELMSQQWTVDAEGLSMLFRSLHVTLNPFSHDTKITLQKLDVSGNGGNETRPLLMAHGVEGYLPETPTISAYTREEHDMGIHHIRHSHPHLFRTHAANELRLHFQKQKKNKEDELLMATEAETGADSAFRNGVNAHFFSFTSSKAVGIESSDVGGEVRVKKVVVRSREELQRLFLGDEVTTEAELDLQRASPSSLLSKDLVDSDNDVVSCTLPHVGHLSQSYTVTLKPLQLVKDGEKSLSPKVQEAAVGPAHRLTRLGGGNINDSLRNAFPVANQSNTTGFIRQCVSSSETLVSSPLLSVSAPCNNDKKKNDSEGDIVSGFSLDARQESALKEERHREIDTGERKVKRTSTTLILTSNQVIDTAHEDIIPNIQQRLKPNAPCVIPAGCTLRLQHLTVHAALTVLGTLEMHDCSFVGHFSSEGKGRVQLSRCDVYVDGPEERRDGILILDASTVEFSDGTTVQKKERIPIEKDHSFSMSPTVPSLLQAFILVSNSGFLRVQGGCRIAPFGTEKTIFAEQDASVEIFDSEILSGISSAVSVLGCRAHLVNTCLYGGNHLEPHVSDITRPTGLNVELGGVVTVCHCLARRLYFGFSVIAHSVVHFYGCHADYVVNGYTIDASSVIIENSSAHTNHVGVFALNKAKCEIRSEVDQISFEERCSLLLLSRKNSKKHRVQVRYDESLNEIHTTQKYRSGNDSKRWSFLYRPDKYFSINEADTTAEDVENVMDDHCKIVDSICPAATFIGKIRECSTSCRAEVTVPLSFVGGLFSLEVRGAHMEAKGVVLADAQDTSIYVYDQGSLTLTDSIVWSTFTSFYQPCGIKVANSQAHVQHCLLMDCVFGFAAIQGSDVQVEKCFSVGGTNGFTIDNARCTLHHCGADTEHVGVFALNQSTLLIDNTNASGNILGGLPCVFRGYVNGLESRSSDTVCTQVVVQRGLDSGFTCYNGGRLVLERCIVDMSVTTTATGATPSSWGLLCQVPSSMRLSSLNSTSVLGARASGCSSHTKNGNRNAGSAAVLTASTLAEDFPLQYHSYGFQKSSGVKAWSGSHCVVIGCEVRHVTFGYAAIGPDTELKASHSTAKHVVNGFTVDSAKCQLSRCSTNSNHVGIFVLANGTCTVRRGSYIARMYGIECRNGTVHVEGHVKLTGFSRIGLYVYDGARCDTSEDSMLDIKFSKDFTQQQLLPSQSMFTGDSITPLGLFPSCFAMDKGTALIRNATFGGGAQCAVSCGDGANADLRQCTVKYCNVAFNALMGSQMYLLDCRAQHVGQYSLIVHRGGTVKMTSHAPSLHTVCNLLEGKVQIDGDCTLDRVVLYPISTSLSRLSSSVAYSLPPQSLICVRNSGNLVMNLCLILYEERQRVVSQYDRVTKDKGGSKEQREWENKWSSVCSGEGDIFDLSSETPKPSVIAAKGCKVKVRLHKVIFQQVCQETVGEINSGSSSPRSSGSVHYGDRSFFGTSGSRGETRWFHLTLRRGATGEICDTADSVHSDCECVSSICGVLTAPIDQRSVISQTMSLRPCKSCMEGGETCAVVKEKNSLVSCGARSDGDMEGLIKPSFSNAIFPLRVQVAYASSLFAERVHFRQLVVLDDSNVFASRCSFAGVEAVLIKGGGTLEAVDSTFVGAVGGPAVVSERATMSLTRCRSYSTWREAFLYSYTTINLTECDLSLILPCDVNKGSESALTDPCYLCNPVNVSGDAAGKRAKKCCKDDGSSVTKGKKRMVVTTLKTALPLYSSLVNGAGENYVEASLCRTRFSSSYKDKNLHEPLRSFMQSGQSCTGSEDRSMECLGLAGKSFFVKSLRKKDEKMMGVSQDISKPAGAMWCHGAAGYPLAREVLGMLTWTRNCCSLRLEHSRLYYHGSSRIEGHIAFDGASRIEICCSSRFWDTVRAMREHTLGLVVFLFCLEPKRKIRTGVLTLCACVCACMRFMRAIATATHFRKEEQPNESDIQSAMTKGKPTRTETVTNKQKKGH